MNWRHLQAFVWLRWRLLRNQWRRAGAFNAVLLLIVSFAAMVMAIPLGIGSFMLGLYAIPRAAPLHLMYAWDGLIAAFLFFWGIGLVTELQRTEPLALSKFLHLPVSVDGAFLINYMSSLLRLSLILLGPVMLGFALALVFVKGMLLLPVLPSLAAFMLMVTALSYQVQGWLAALMSNPRRRRTVIMSLPVIFVLIVQLPNLLNVLAPWGARDRLDRSARLTQELAKMDGAFQSQEFDAKEFVRRKQEIIEKYKLDTQQVDRETVRRGQETARLVNTVLPVGWLPLGVMAGAEGQVMPAILGLLGMALIGAASLWRAYRTTIRLYQGEFTSRKGRPAAAVALPASVGKAGVPMLEARIPGFSEPVSAIALGGLRSLVRAPEAKIMLLSPLLMSVFFGAWLWKGSQSIPDSVRPLVATAGMVFVLLGMLQLMANQFGFDRDGFRVFVLCAAPRRDILLGKNLAFAPLALGMAAIVLTFVQAVCPMRLDHFLAMFPQYLSMFLLFCIMTN